jgi:FG-GAP repeat
MSRFASSQLRLALAIVPCLLTAASATTLLDPRPEPSTTRFGLTIVTMGDLNGDGVPDLAVAAPFQDGDFDSTQRSFGKPQNVGKIYLIDGANLSVLNELNDPEFQQVQLRHFGGQIGASMAAVADLNGDGITDLIAGVPHHIAVTDLGEIEINAGEAFVFSGKDGVVLFNLSDPTAEEDGKMGAAVAGGKDFNRDGKPDFVVGSPNLEGFRGAAYIFNGSDGSLQRTLLPGGRQPFAKFGSSLCVSDDLTGDRRPDVAVGAPGQNVNGLLQAGAITVFDGRRGRAVQTISSASPQVRGLFGTGIAAADFDGNRTETIIAGTPNQNAIIDTVSHLEIGQIEIQP